MGSPYPDDRGEGLGPAGRASPRGHGELVVDASLGLAIGEVIRLGRDDYTVVGITAQLLGRADAVMVATVSDTQRIANDDSRTPSSPSATAGSPG
ncbi:MAG: hypothetical protein IPJ34_42465 [Myxococcales bacterium]|nr:hypothetical protein [Myxococcales bacterium]